MFNLHSWDRTGDWSIVNEPFGLVFSKQPGLLRMVAQLRSELERSAPYETFGQPVMPELRLLVSHECPSFSRYGWRMLRELDERPLSPAGAPPVDLLRDR